MTAQNGDARSGTDGFLRATHGMQAPGSPHARADDTVTLSEVLGVVRRWWWLVGGAAVLGLASAGAWVLSEVPQYRATAVLRIGEVRDAVTRGIENPSGESNRYVNLLSSQVQLVRSRTLIGEVVDSVGFRLQPEQRGLRPGLLEAVHVGQGATADTLWLGFDHDGFKVRTRNAEQAGVYGEPVEIDGVRFVLGGQPSTKNATWLVSPREQAVDRLLGSLNVSARSETNIVDVSFDHPDPVTAQRIVNTLVTRYQTFDANFAQEAARRRRVFLEEQLAQTDANLAQAQRRLSAFRNRAQTYDAREELAAQQQNRLVLDIRREELDADRRMFRNLLERLDNSTGGGRWEVLRTLVSSPGIAENPVVSQMHQQLLRYRTSLDSLTTGVFGNAGTNPDVQRLRALIAGAEGELISAIRSHLASLDARAEALEELSSRMSSEMAQLPPHLAEEARLAQMVETYRKMGDQLREDYQKAGMAEAVAVGQADIVDLAARPYKPLSGIKKLKLALGLVMGLGLGGAGAFILEHRNPSIRRRDEVETLFHLPLLGVIPRASSELDESGWKLLPANGAEDGEGEGDGEVDLEVDVESGPSPVLARHPSLASEAYRMLRTNLLFGDWARDVKSLVVTSTTPREGKTLTSIHLAASIAEEGRRVLLVDGDLWRGRIHEVVGVPESPGLAEMLAVEAAPDAQGTRRALQWAAIRSTGVPRLSLLPRGRSHPNPSALTRTAEFRKVLQRVGHDFDLIIIDAPPVLATASGPALATVADGVMLVIRAGRTDREAVREALRELATVGAHVVGAVLNDPSGKTFYGEPYYYAYAK